MNIDGFGFRIKGSKCSENELSCERPSQAPTSEPNFVDSALHCVSIWQNSQERCSKIENFKTKNCIDYGIYAQVTSSLIAENIEISNSGTGITALIYGANSRQHVLENKAVKFSNLKITMSKSLFFETEMMKRTENLRSPKNFLGGQTAIVIPVFASELNRAPIDEWSQVWSEPALLGASCFSNIEINFVGNSTNFAAISSNGFAKDFTHPLSIRNITVNDPLREAQKILIEPPKIEWIDAEESAVCMDMDCDGGKKVLIHDLGI